ncbi:MAG: ABC transporter substrate-binding protein [Chloroflexota bacterium]
MNQHKQLFFALCLLNSFVFFLVSCAAPAPMPSDVSAPVEPIRIALKRMPTNLDPLKIASADAYKAVWPLYDGLLTLDKENRLIQAGLAKQVTFDPAYQTYTLHLREDVQFHNGESFTAESVRFSWERGATAAADTVTVWSVLKEVEVLEPYIIQFTPESSLQGEEKLAAFMMMLARLPIVPVHYIDEVGEEGFQQSPIGTGPYRLSTWDQENGILEMEPFDNYWNEDISLSAPIHFTNAPSEQIIVAIEENNIDAIFNPSKDEVAQLDGYFDRFEQVSEQVLHLSSLTLPATDATSPYALAQPDVQNALKAGIGTQLFSTDFSHVLEPDEPTKFWTSPARWSAEFNREGADLSAIHALLAQPDILDAGNLELSLITPENSSFDLFLKQSIMDVVQETGMGVRLESFATWDGEEPSIMEQNWIVFPSGAIVRDRRNFNENAWAVVNENAVMSGWAEQHLQQNLFTIANFDTMSLYGWLPDKPYTRFTLEQLNKHFSECPFCIADLEDGGTGGVDPIPDSGLVSIDDPVLFGGGFFPDDNTSDIPIYQPAPIITGPSPRPTATPTPTRIP